MSSTTIITNVGTTQVGCTGQGTQQHLVYCENVALWILFYIEGTDTTKLRTANATSLGGTWTVTALGTNDTTLPQTHDNDGRNFSVAYLNVGSTDVIQIGYAGDNGSSNAFPYYSRATVSGTTITFSAWVALDTAESYSAAGIPSGNTVCWDTNNKAAHAVTYGSHAAYDIAIWRATNADLGSSWTAAFTNTGGDLDSGQLDQSHSTWIGKLAGGNLLATWDSGNIAGLTDLKTVRWSKWGGTSWTTAANANTALATAVSGNNYDCVDRSTTAIDLVLFDTSGVPQHLIFGGTSWAAGAAMPTPSSFKQAGGVAMATDGTNTWCAVIFNDAANSVNYVKYNGTSWGSWTALESTTQVRNSIGCYQYVKTSNIGFYWTENNSTNFNIVTEALSTASAVFNLFTTFNFAN